MTQNKTQTVERRIRLLERRLYFAYLIIIAAILLQVGSFMWSPAQANNELTDGSNKVIKTRGIIIVDDQGKERILLGAPIPAAKNRVRTDLARVKEIWGKRFPEKYLEYYKNYNHNVNGMLVLDQNGFDRLVVGDGVTDPNTGKRIGTETGLIFNDEEGFERGGFGLLKVKDKYRVALGMDSEKSGSEGLTLSLEDGGIIGMGIYDNKSNSTFMGFLPPNSFNNETAEPFNGVLMKQGKEIKYQINTLQKK
jgi:hypothetical protein